jgi:uncharacterized protein YbjQ (UPF0145 family)
LSFNAKNFGGSFMKNYKISRMIVPVFLLVTMALMTSCSTLAKLFAPPVDSVVEGSSTESGAAGAKEPSMPLTDSWSYSVGWSWYTRIQNRDYSVVDIVVLRDVKNPTYELMEAAKALGADDVINVRVDTKEESGKTTLLAASGVAIKYKPVVYEGGSEVGEKLFDSGAVQWSKYMAVPSKNFTIVGIVTAKCETSQTPAADLMEAAKNAGAHDVINILVDTKKPDKGGKNQVVSASGVAIKYNDQNI